MLSQQTKRTLSSPFTVASLSSVLTIIVTVVGAIFFLDDRYAHAESVMSDQQQILLRQNEIKSEIEDSISNVVKQLKLNDLNNRIQLAEDQLYVLDTIPDSNKTPQESAQKERLDRRLNDMRSERRTLRALP